MKMKRKRKNSCPSPLLDDSPKRTKVHAQRKFAQGSNVNSPVITPIRELESESPKIDVLPEPVELLPRKRPNTEDFLTFLCFRGTPILPPSLNFFNTASIVDTNGQVHEIKSESSSKHGPIDIAKCGTSSEKPFVAFGVRKRADPVVISRQMDRKRRHALAIQALRRKYQEQKMAKIRALTISKLSEKVTNKTLVRTNTVSKTETITKKTNTVQKTKVVATKHIKVTTRTLKTTLKPKLKIKQNMCLRSFRGRFIQQELPFRKKIVQDKPVGRSLPERIEMRKRGDEARNANKQNQAGPSKQSKPMRRKIVKKIVTASPAPIRSRFTRSSLTNTKSEMRKQIKRRILIPNSNIIIKTKPRSLRLTTVKKSVLSRRKSNSLKMKQKVRAAIKFKNFTPETPSKPEKTEESRPKRSPLINKGDTKHVEKKDLRQTINKNIESRETNKGTDIKKDFKKVTDLKKEVQTISDRDKRRLTRSVDVRKEINTSTDIKKKPNLTVEIKKSTRISNVIHKKINTSKNADKNASDKGTSPGKSSEEKSKNSEEKSKSPEERSKRSTRRSDSTKNVNSSTEESNDNEKSKGTPSSQKKSKTKIVDSKSDEPEHPSPVRNARNLKKPKEKTVEVIDKSQNKPDDHSKQQKESGNTGKKIKKSKQKKDTEISKKMFEPTNTNGKSNKNSGNTENKNTSNSVEVIPDEDNNEEIINSKGNTGNTVNINDKNEVIFVKDNDEDTENSKNVSVENVETEIKKSKDVEGIKADSIKNDELDAEDIEKIKAKDLKSTNNVKKAATEDNKESKEPDNINDQESSSNPLDTPADTDEDSSEPETIEEDTNQEGNDKPKDKIPKVERKVIRKTSISIRKQTEVIKETIISTKNDVHDSPAMTKTKKDTERDVKEEPDKEKVSENAENILNSQEDEEGDNESLQNKVVQPDTTTDTNEENMSDEEENALYNQEKGEESLLQRTMQIDSNKTENDVKEQTNTKVLLDEEKNSIINQELIYESPSNEATQIKTKKDEEQYDEEKSLNLENVSNIQKVTNELTSKIANQIEIKEDFKDDVTDQVDEIFSDEEENALIIQEDSLDSFENKTEDENESIKDQSPKEDKDEEAIITKEYFNEPSSQEPIQTKSKKDTNMDLKEITNEGILSSETTKGLINLEEYDDISQTNTTTYTEEGVKEQLDKEKIINEDEDLPNQEQTCTEQISDEENYLSHPESTNKLPNQEELSSKQETKRKMKKNNTEQSSIGKLCDEEENVLPNQDLCELLSKELLKTKKEMKKDIKEQSSTEKLCSKEETVLQNQDVGELLSKKMLNTEHEISKDINEQSITEKLCDEEENVLPNQEEISELPSMKALKTKKEIKKNIKEQSSTEKLYDEDENALPNQEEISELLSKKVLKANKEMNKDIKKQSSIRKLSEEEENVLSKQKDVKEILLKKSTQFIGETDTTQIVKDDACQEEENSFSHQDGNKELLSKKVAQTITKREIKERPIKGNYSDQETSATSKQECTNEAPLKKAIQIKSKKSTKKILKEQFSKSKISDQEETASSSRDEPPVKKSTRLKRDIKKDTKEKFSDHEEYAPRSQRPSRKTKEAAAIYMEILSHKLVDNKIDDDDTISIDSFPELPNVKRTEQREIELKAKAKTSKRENKGRAKFTMTKIEDKTDDIEETQIEDKKEDVVGLEKDNKNEPLLGPSSSKTKKKDSVKVGKRKSVTNNSDESEEEAIKPKLRKSDIAEKPEVHNTTKTKLRKSCPEIIQKVVKEEVPKLDNPSTSTSIEETAKSKLKKSDAPKASEIVEENKPRRLTRHSLYANRSDDYDSDESFHINVKVPRKKKNTRSRVSPRVSKGTKQANMSSSESDQSTTSDVNIPVSLNKGKNKKFSKTKSMKKSDNFSDTDEEEPLLKNVESTKKSPHKPEKPKENVKEVGKSKKLTNKTTEQSPTRGAKSKPVQKSPEPESTKIEPKPKRECAKLPQNYLPMFSSSDEDDIFHGFDEKVEKNTKTCETSCSHAPPLLDLLNKDLGRRFGKEKVNMSNEQIEKWLKDAALAGSSIKKENDEMLKFGERIPTETNLELAETIDTDKLKQSLSELVSTQEEPKEPKSESTTSTPVKAEAASKVADSGKPQLDRKLIFRKSKTVNAPNINAFSPENECSVYAFGEENEDVISTPFRRPSRRPSSTATSKSEDESCKQDESLKTNQFRKPTVKQEPSKAPVKDEPPEVTLELEDNKQFYVPQKPTIKSTILKPQSKPLFKSRSSEKLPDIDEFKYKIPSSPSASSSSSAKLYKRQPQKHKARQNDAISPVYVSDFPKQSESAKLVEAPVFHPTEQEFQDPLEYIERIRHKAEQFGICRIVPASSFKPECKVTDDMRFTAYNQYVGKMLYRWGPNFKELMAIKKYLETQNIALNHPPWIGGMEIDLPRLYQTVQTLGGLREVIEKKKWSKVSDLMKIPKSAQDRVTKLDDIYCKYLLPYDILSPAEREKLFDEVETEWAKRESKTLLTEEQKTNMDSATEGDSDIEDRESEECTTKGRNMALNAFYRIARNTMSMYFKTNEPLPQEVEQEYWKYVTQRQNHICVHSGSIDCGNWGYGFAVSKHSPFAKHPWNLKVLTNNCGSVLRCLGPLMGVTVPTLHVGMVFSACCWYRDPHGLPWIEYLHTGGSKIWYGIPNTMGEQFHLALKKLTPNYCKNKELWLPSDTVMVPPNLLVENQVSLCHTVQEPGQFVVVFPKAFTSSISTGYVVSESVYFAPIYWLKTARSLFDALRQSNEPAMFSFDRLLLNVVNDPKCNIEIVRQSLPMVQELCGQEIEKREKLYGLGEITREKLPIPEVNKGKKKKFQQGEEGDYECELCRSSLFLSMVFDTVEGITYCLDHAIELVEKKDLQLANCKFMFTYDDEELKSLPEKGKNLMESRLQKKVPSKFAGLPTLLGK